MSFKKSLDHFYIRYFLHKFFVIFSLWVNSSKTRLSNLKRLGKMRNAIFFIFSFFFCFFILLAEKVFFIVIDKQKVLAEIRTQDLAFGRQGRANDCCATPREIVTFENISWIFNSLIVLSFKTFRSKPLELLLNTKKFQ